MFYVIDVRLIAPAFMDTLLMIARIWNIFNDSLMGMMVDNTRGK